jgi:hypothetical protein
MVQGLLEGGHGSGIAALLQSPQEWQWILNVNRKQ